MTTPQHSSSTSAAPKSTAETAATNASASGALQILAQKSNGAKVAGTSSGSHAGKQENEPAAAEALVGQAESEEATVEQKTLARRVAAQNQQASYPPTPLASIILAQAENCFRQGNMEKGRLLIEELLLNFPDCVAAKKLLIEFKLVPDWKLREWDLKQDFHMFVDENVQVYEGDEARKRLRFKNDAPYQSENGIINVPLTRWEEAQRYERKTWMEQNLNAVDDRNLFHTANFENFQALNGLKFENVIELGCGPFTNLRVILPLVQGEGQVDLLDPLVRDYILHPNCAYRSGEIAGRPVRLFASPIEQFLPDKQYDLVVMINVLEHCYDIPLIFKKVSAMLKPGGIFVFSDSAVDEHSVRSQQVYDAGHPIRMTNAYLRTVLQQQYQPAFWKSFRETSSLSHRDISHYFIGTHQGAAPALSLTVTDLWQAAKEYKRNGDDLRCLEALELLIQRAPAMDQAKRMRTAVKSCPEAAWTYTQVQDHLIQIGCGFHENFIALESLTRRFGLKTGVELGVLSGYHSRHLLEACPELRLYCVDAYRQLRPGNGYDDVTNAEWENRYETAKRALDPFGRATMVRATTTEALSLIKSPVDFVFIDADHSYESVREDIQNWYSHISIGGVLSGHDYGNASWPGVEQAVRELLPVYGLRPVEDHGFVWWAQKTEASVELMARHTEQLPPDQAVAFLLKQLDGGTDHWSVRLALTKAYLRRQLPSQAREFLKSVQAPDETVRLEIKSLQSLIHPQSEYLNPAIGDLPVASTQTRPAAWTFATAASAEYFPQVVNLIGSIHRHAIKNISKIVLYDLGLTAEQTAFLSQLAAVKIKSVPAFYTHAFSWWTWKLWAIKDCAETETSECLLYCDSGVQLQNDPAPIFEIIAQQGYALWHAGGHLNRDWTTAEVYRSLGLIKEGDSSLQIMATVQGYTAQGWAKVNLNDTALKLAGDERLMRPSSDCVDNRHDQSLMSLLVRSKQVQLLEPQPLIVWENSPEPAKRQAAIWLCRSRGIGSHDGYLLRKSAATLSDKRATTNPVLELPQVISNENSLRGEFLRDLAGRLGIRAFVETGTYLGGTAATASDIFEVVHTIELSAELAEQARARLAVRKNVRVYQGDSSDLLPQILKEIRSPVLFWLDGHWSTGRTARGKVNTPILGELRAIKESGLKDAVILIDDLRLFGKPSQAVDCSSSLYGYPDLNEIHRAVLAIDGGYQFLVLGDVALAYPAVAQLTPSPVVMALTLSRLYNGKNLSSDEIFEAENVLTHAEGEERELIRALASQRADVEQYGLGLHYRFWHALILVGEKRFTEAGNQFVAAAQLGFDHWRLQWYLARSLAASGQTAIATEVLDRLLRQMPLFRPAEEFRQQLGHSTYNLVADAQGSGPLSFSNNWFEAHESFWRSLLIPWATERGPLNILEIGSFEGRSTCWLLAHLLKDPQSAITCIDLWQPGSGNPECNTDMEQVFKTFKSNIEATGQPNKVRVLRGHSHELLKTQPDTSFDLIYVDGDHSAAGVFGDSLEAFRVLKQGGLLLWDDYYWCASVKEGVDQACAKLNIQICRWGNNASYQKPNIASATVINKPMIVGLVVGRNEAPRLSFCLRALAKYTDAIVYLDDSSEDRSVEVVQSLSSECRVERILRKDRWHLDEPGDRNILLTAGREIGGTHFVAIDADEAFTSNCAEEGFLRRLILSLLPGDQIAVNWIQLWRDVHQYRHDNSVWTWNYKGVIFCDDGQCAHSSEFVHTPRVPANLSGQCYRLPGYVHGLMHFQFVNWRNLLVKQAWYRCLERVRDPEKTAAAINGRYAPSKDETDLGLHSAPAAWLAGYPFFDVAIVDDPEWWREKQIRQWFEQYGKAHFKELDIWDLDWSDAQVIVRDARPLPAPSENDTKGEAVRFMDLAVACQTRSDLRGARNALLKALDWAPNNIELVLATGAVSLQLGDAKSARWLATLATLLQPENAISFVRLAEAALALERIPEFEHALGRALELSPNDPTALRLLGTPHRHRTCGPRSWPASSSRH
jgi:predicted O-methyltransferase YrrM/ubiquinone/menaquinone biosynthesis C-methylase UbiE